MSFTREYIDLAYRKFKSYVYYDNFSLLLRQELASFESGEDFNKRLDSLVKFLNSPVQNKQYFDKLLESISYDIAPKKFGRPKRNDDDLRLFKVKFNFQLISFR